MNADLVYANGGKYRKLGEAYNRANYVENDRNTYLATANGGYNRSLLGKAVEGSTIWSKAGDFVAITAAGIKVVEKASKSEMESFSTGYGKFKSTGRIRGPISSSTVSRYGRIAANSNFQLTKNLGKGLGVVGGVLTVIDGFSDGNFSRGDVFKTVFSFGTMIPGVGTALGLIDLGLKLTTDEGGISDRVGKWIDKK